MTALPTDRSPQGHAGLLDVPGFRGAAVSCGVKPSKELDLAVIVTDQPVGCAGMFTTSAVAAAPVELCRDKLDASPTVQSIVINSGNANALTGERGAEDALAMSLALEKHCGGPGLVLSTGVIGVPLPIHAILDGIEVASRELTDEAGRAVARAILTTDTCEKTALRSVAVGSETYVVGGIAKGSGMIHPKMATMLAIIGTDAPVPQDSLKPLLQEAVDQSFHQISVDGDTSTNDAVLLLAPPAESGGTLTGAEMAGLQAAITEVARELAGQIIRDGEGRTRTLSIRVTGAAAAAEARAVAESIARSSLVKTALAGGDPNWGRILAAAGNAGVPIKASDLTLSLGGHEVFRRGETCRHDEAAVAKVFAAEEVDLELHLSRGECSSRMLTTDLTKRYVEINADYTT